MNLWTKYLLALRVISLEAVLCFVGRVPPPGGLVSGTRAPAEGSRPTTAAAIGNRQSAIVNRQS